MQSDSTTPSSPEKKKPRKVSYKYGSKEEQIKMSRIQTKIWIDNNKDKKWHCESCNRTYNYFAKSAHLKSKVHNKEKVKSEEQKEKIKEQVKADQDRLATLFKNFVSAVEAFNAQQKSEEITE